MIRSLNNWLAALLLLAAMCAVSPAHAQDDGKRVAVMRFTGASAAAFQGQVTQALKQRSEVELVSTSEVQDTASRLGNSLSSDTEYREVGEALELSAFIEGNVVKKGKNLEATVRVRDAGSGAVVHEETWTRRRSQVRALKPVVWGALGPAIAQTSPPAPKAKPKPTKPVPVAEPAPRPKPKPVKRLDEDEERERVRERERAREDDDDDKPRRADGKSARHPALVAAIGPQLMWRKLSYEGDTNFNNYKNEAGSPGVNLALSAQYYPGAHVSNEWYSNLGLDLDLAYTLGLKSKQEDKATGKEKEYDTTAYEFGIGAIYRFPLGDFEPRLRLGYLKQVFDVDVAEGTFLPAVDYSSLRFGAGMAVRIADPISFEVAFAYLFVLGAGELEKPIYGEEVETSGWEAGAGFLLHIKEVYGLRLGLDYRRYSYDFGLSDSAMLQRLPKSGSDGYLKLALSFVYSLPGVSGR